MKKVFIFIGISIVLSAIALIYLGFYYLSVGIHMSTYIGLVPSETDYYIATTIQDIVQSVIWLILGLSLAVSSFFYFYRFDGVPLWKKLAEKYEESKAARAEYRAKKTAEGRKKRAEQLQARMAAMQAEMDAMKDETDEPKE